MLCDLLDRLECFLRDAGTVYVVRMAILDHPIVNEFYSLWEMML